MFSSRRSPYLPQINAKQTQIEPLSHRETTCRIIGAAFEVHNTLGHGFLEKVYQRAMQVELIKRGSSAQTETSIQVLYKNAVVGEYYADLFVDGCVIVEIKVAKSTTLQTRPNF
jgi:GxxExxY protein